VLYKGAPGTRFLLKYKKGKTEQPHQHSADLEMFVLEGKLDVEGPDTRFKKTLNKVCNSGLSFWINV